MFSYMVLPSSTALTIVVKLSSYMQLNPWDIILTGSPATMGNLTYLKPGEQYIVEIDGLPALKNRFFIKQ